MAEFRPIGKTIDLRRIGRIVEIVATGISVTFHPNDKNKTFNEIMEKCAEHSTEMDKASNTERQISIDMQLTDIYTEYHELAEKDELEEIYTQKYTDGSPWESVLVGGSAYFLSILDEKACLEKEKPLDDIILLPPKRTDYLSKPYTFESIEEIQAYVERARRETYDSLYQMLKSIWKKYAFASDNHIAICAADTLFTYFQDKIGQTHYLWFVGDNGTGKTNNLRVFQYLGYRPLLGSNVTGPNIYQYLGSLEEGQGIYLEDEAEGIERSRDKLDICRTGYQKDGKVPRIDMQNGRKQKIYLTYCFKAFAAERTPDIRRAKGLMERIFVLQCTVGKPPCDISEVASPAGDKKYSALLEELLDARKLLLIYRLLHFDDPMPDVELTVVNRDKQLTKPLLRLFHRTTAFDEIRLALWELLKKRSEVRMNSLEGVLYPIITNLVAKEGPSISTGTIWEAVTDSLEGSTVPNKPMSYMSAEFGLISQKDITQILKDKFGAVQSRDSKARVLEFKQQTLTNLAASYQPPAEIQLIRDKTDGMTGVTDMAGLDGAVGVTEAG